MALILSFALFAELAKWCFCAQKIEAANSVHANGCSDTCFCLMYIRLWIYYFELLYVSCHMLTFSNLNLIVVSSETVISIMSFVCGMDGWMDYLIAVEWMDYLIAIELLWNGLFDCCWIAVEWIFIEFVKNLFCCFVVFPSAFSRVSTLGKAKRQNSRTPFFTNSIKIHSTAIQQQSNNPFHSNSIAIK